ncbi:ABC-2 type transport system ATP-binding protein [Nocardiopsis sp. Huas11]|uniref:ABC transporter ATP-binding protein n=1 Tax=Nocardiopsis sp. Huas11 TaxID=2183912 RepID=UPI000EB0034E|nr:ABC transporter ATP-binding protein [Nocardiopsis sp. Huas11]RKS06880.1 ABC-2 type transport system ATP-binding protein [Nocardiopsis sp. Huas11]
MSILEARGISKRYGDNLAVDDISFSIEEGETYGLLGPNGAGKSTTIQMIAGISTMDAGEILIAGIEHGPTNRKSKALIGYVPQEVAVYEELSARDNLRFFGRMYGLSGAEARKRADEILETIGLTDRAREAVSKYSGGMTRRLNIGVGLLNRPRLLILDEPTVGVDPQSRHSILESIHALAQDGMSVLYTTHYMEEAEQLCDRIGILEGGRIRAEGTQRELVAQVGENDTVLVDLGTEGREFTDSLEAIEAVREVVFEGDQMRLLAEDARGCLPLVMKVLTESGADVRSVRIQEPDLETVFLSLTGKALRE